MRNVFLGLCAAALAGGSALAQGAGDQMTFEVVSIKTAAPMPAGKMMIGMRGGPGTADPGHLTYTNVSVKSIVVNAFGVKSYQVSGPDWMDSVRFDLVAKVPQGATKDDVKIMLQNMLKERFHLTFHHDKKDMPMYALVVGKNGPKMKESPEDPPEATTGGPNDTPPPPKPDAPVIMPKISVGPDGTIKLPPGMGPKTGCMMMMMMSPAGPKSHMQCTKRTMADLSEQLSNQMDKPVSDNTGLTAKYDFNLDFLPDDNRMMAMMPAGGGMMMHDSGPGPGPGGPKGEAPEQVSLAPLPAALQEQLGLKLEQKKGPVDLIVIDKIDREPIEN